MGEKLTLDVDARDVRGKKVAKLRAEGLIPGVVYGADMEPANVQVAKNVFEKVYRQAGTYTPVHITIGGKKKIVMIKDIERNPANARIDHVSFHAVNVKEAVIADVPIVLVGEGESEAEKNGLIVLQALERIEVKALPLDLPDAIEISILNLVEPGDKVTLADATLPKGVEFVEHESGHADDEDRPAVTEQMVASVWEPAALQASNDAAAGDAEDESEVEAENGADDAEPAAEKSE